MKVNLKKIGAIVAGAAILASSAAFAGLMFGSTTLVDSNGAPVAKVVIGSNAAPSDGVAAALIAGKMVSETYAAQTLTAQVSGSAACKPGSDNASNGSSCTLSNKKATLDITVPGTLASGTWSVSNLIGDYLQRTLLERKPLNASDTTLSYPLTTSDTSASSNPFTNGNSSSIGTPTDVSFFKIGPEFSVFADKTLNDKQSGDTFTEHQSLWLEGDNHYSSDFHDIGGRLTFVLYDLDFDGPGSSQLGIPVCSQSDVNGSYATCATSDSNWVPSHKVQIQFLGQTWIISNMVPPTTALSTEVVLANGGQVNLAKESVSGILNQGESLPVDDIKVRLDDLEAHGDTTAAIVSLVDANGNVLVQDTIAPGVTDQKTVNGKKYRIHVYKVAPGYTFGAKWADMAVYSQELIMYDNQYLDSQNNDNNGWYVSLGWKDRGASSTNTKPSTLRTILIWANDMTKVASNNDPMAPGQFVNLMTTPAVWQLTYQGVDLQSTDRSSLKFQLRPQSKTISNVYVNGSTSKKCEIFAPYLDVTSGDAGSIFTITSSDGLGQLSNNEFFVALNGVNGTKQADISGLGGGSSGGAITNAYSGALCDYSLDGVLNSTDVTGGNLGGLPAGTVFMAVSPASNAGYGYANYTSGGLEVQYQKIGDGNTVFASPSGGAILIEYGNDANLSTDGHVGALLTSAGFSNTGATALGQNPTNATYTSTLVPDLWFSVAEKAGVGVSNNYVDYYMFPINKVSTGSASDATFQFNSVDGSGANSLSSNNHQILYGHATANTPATGYNGTLTSGPVQSKVQLQSEGYVSERGSVFVSQASDSVSFNMADKLGHGVWVLAPVSSSTASASTTVWTGGVGDSTSVGGVTVKVDSINETLGAGCSAAGAAPACTADMSGVSAVIMPNNAASVSVAMPYSYSKYGNLVILDQDAAGVNTLISVGGDKVNTVTANLLQGSAVDWSAQKTVVKEVVQGSKIVVAGAQAQDTLQAAQDFVSQLKKV